MEISKKKGQSQKRQQSQEEKLKKFRKLLEETSSNITTSVKIFKIEAGTKKQESLPKDLQYYPISYRYQVKRMLAGFSS